MFDPICIAPEASPIWLGAKVTVKFADWPAARAAGMAEVSMEKALGSYTLRTAREIAGTVMAAVEALLRVKTIGLVTLKEVLGKLSGELLPGVSVRERPPD